METYDLIVIGSGFRSVGLAEGLGNALIIDGHFLVDPVHYGTLSGFTRDPCKVFSENSRDLTLMLTSLGVVGHGRIDVPALESCLAEYVRKRGLKMLLGATLIGVDGREGDYTVRIQTSAGEMTVTARNVIDCRPQASDGMRFLMYGDPKKLPAGNRDGFCFSVSEAFYDGEFVLSLTADEAVKPVCLMPKALSAVAAVSAESGVKIVSVAQNAFLSADSIYESDPITAFEKGFEEGVRMKK